MPVMRNQNWLPSIFNDFFADDWMMPRAAKQFASPAVNIIENERDYRIEIAAPGMTKADFKIEIDNDNALVISLEKCSERTDGNAPRKQEANEQPAGKPEEKPAERASEKSSEKSLAKRSEGGQRSTFLRREFSYGSFRQSFILPDEVDRNKIEASMENGVLEICLPKKAEQREVPQSRRIEIR